MKHILAFILANICCFCSYAQYTYQLKADSVRIHNDSCKAELIIENSTKDVPGFLFNRGKGRTEFRKGVVKLNDSAYVFGNDTIKLGVSKETDPSAIKNQYSIGQNASFWINGRGRTRGLFTVDSAIGFSPQSDPLNHYEGQMYYSSNRRKFRGRTDSTWQNFLMNEQTDDATLNKLTLKDDVYVAAGKGITIERVGEYSKSGQLTLGTKLNTRPFIEVSGTIYKSILKVDASGLSENPPPPIDISGFNRGLYGPVIRIDITNDHPHSVQTGIDITIAKKVLDNGDMALPSIGMYGVKSTVIALSKAAPYTPANFHALYGKAVRRVPDSLGATNMYALYADSGIVFIRGAHEVNRTVLSSSSTLNDTHYYLAADATARGFTITLPAASTCNGRIYIIKKIDSTANVITVMPIGSDTIDGASNNLLSIPWQRVTIISTGTGWEII